MKGLLFGDMHTDDSHKGRHQNYLKVSFEWMIEVEDIVRKENPDFVVILGDLIGVRGKALKHRSVLLEVCMFYTRLNSMVNGNVFVVQGNHDIGQNTDFDFLHGLGMFKTSYDAPYIDLINNSGKIGARFHIVDYGKEKEELKYFVEPVSEDENSDENTSNIVLAHNNFSIDGQTTWYYSKCDNTPKSGYILNTMHNWRGCDMVVAGHIHNPSPYMCNTQIDGKDISLFYPGCGSRPIYEKNIYDKVWYMVFEYTDESDYVNFDALPINLKPESEVFIQGEFVEDLTDEEVNENLRKEELDAIIKDLIKYRIADGDPITMIEMIPNSNPRSVAIAKNYINMAYEKMGNTYR